MRIMNEESQPVIESYGRTYAKLDEVIITDFSFRWVFNFFIILIYLGVNVVTAMVKEPGNTSMRPIFNTICFCVFILLAFGYIYLFRKIRRACFVLHESTSKGSTDFEGMITVKNGVYSFRRDGKISVDSKSICCRDSKLSFKLHKRDIRNFQRNSQTVRLELSGNPPLPDQTILIIVKEFSSSRQRENLEQLAESLAQMDDSEEPSVFPPLLGPQEVQTAKSTRLLHILLALAGICAVIAYEHTGTTSGWDEPMRPFTLFISVMFMCYMLAFGQLHQLSQWGKQKKQLEALLAAEGIVNELPVK